MTVAIGMGSNQGDRYRMLTGALKSLKFIASGKVRASPLYETAPVHCPPGSDHFLNAAAVFDYDGSPHELLAFLRNLEESAGRQRSDSPNAPRPVDLDILIFGESVLESDDLTIPHPRMHERLFVLKPLNDIAPDLMIPALALTVREALANLDPNLDPEAAGDCRMLDISLE